MSAGKTLVMTYLMVKEADELGKTLLSNYSLLKRDHVKIEPEDLMAYTDNQVSLRNVAIGIDEIHLWFDSRMSMGERNRVLSYFVTQTSKNDINLYGTTQDFGMVDRRLRKQTTIIITVKQISDTHFHVRGMNRYTGKKVIDVFLDGREWFAHFDTHEVIAPPRVKGRRGREPQIVSAEAWEDVL